MKRAGILAGVLAVGAVALGAYSGRAAEKLRQPRAGAVPVIVELFTSEGCSSCPPADAALAKLTDEQPVPGAHVIALGEHVDYWDRLGWKDPFSSAQFSRRQSDYATAFRKDDVYTPQAVVNGAEEFVGSEKDKLRAAVARAAQAPRAAVTLTGTPGNFTLHAAELPKGALRPGEKVEIYAAITEDGLTSSVARGENAGSKLAHSAVVRKLERVGVWDPSKASSYTATVAAKRGPRQHVVAFLQATQSRRILGAAEGV
jgi:hypothetical protein